MKLLLPLLIAFSWTCSPAQALDLSQHAFFKHLIGEWKAEGKLTGENNNIVTVTETWTGKVDAENSFSITGARTLNGDTQKFTWVFTHNSSTDSYEALLSGGDGQPIRFEGSISDVTQVMELKAITGNGSSSIAVQDSFEGVDHNTLISKVTFTGDQGQTTLAGTITHQRVKAP